MEVHAHTHTARKKWTHYLWEFLMLFLAVFCGFLAEYQLEHVIEHQREQKYVESLIQDLKTDTAHLESYINLRREKRSMMDSLVLLLSTDKHKQFGNETYFFARHVFFGQPFVSTDGTMQQLKNAGGMRLIRNDRAADSILLYDRETRFIQIHIETSLYKNQRDLQDMENKLYDFSLIPGWGQGKSRGTLQYPVYAPLLSYDPSLLRQYKNELINAQRDYANQFIYLSNLKLKAENLIVTLKKEYNTK